MPEVTLHLIAAARPNFMKVAPLWHALSAESWCRPVLVHTGQHYDATMSDAFFADLSLPKPDVHLGVGSGSHAEQTAKVMMAYEKVLIEAPPAMTIVVGDVNSTLACALAAKKLADPIPVAHLEAGLRSGDRRMPEEINRLVTDAISDVLWTPSPDAVENLQHEGVPDHRITNVGNIMIDSYEMMRPKIEAAHEPKARGLKVGGYGIATLHRPSNVDMPDRLSDLVGALTRVAADMPIVLPLHPRTRGNLQKFGLYDTLAGAPGIHISEPLGYITFMSLVSAAAIAITDSGGIQEETTYLGVPCVTLRENTERPITISEGTNRLSDISRLEQDIGTALKNRPPKPSPPALWDGATAGRIVADLKRRLEP